MSETTSYALLNDPRIGKMDASLDKILADITIVKADLSVVKADISTIKSDISEMKSDISSLKIDQALTKAYSAVTRSNITELKADMRDTRDRALRLETNVAAGFKSVLLFCAFIAALISFMPKILQLLGIIKL